MKVSIHKIQRIVFPSNHTDVAKRQICYNRAVSGHATRIFETMRWTGALVLESVKPNTRFSILAVTSA